MELKGKSALVTGGACGSVKAEDSWAKLGRIQLPGRVGLD